MTEGYERQEAFFEGDSFSREAEVQSRWPMRWPDGPQSGSGVAEGLVRLRELAVRRAARLHRHAIAGASTAIGRRSLFESRLIGLREVGDELVPPKSRSRRRKIFR